YLIALWNDVQERFASSKAPSILHRDLDLTQRIIREQYSEDIGKIVIDDQKLADKVSRLLNLTSPGSDSRLEVYSGATPIFDVYGIEMDIGRALSKKVDLPSGGYVIVDQTEALTSFDVNTGRYVGRTNASETCLKTNLEAVRKVGAQLKLRNIGGIIIIDFIDMEDPVNRERVFNALIDELKNDKARTNVLKISELGLVQMTRKRTSDSLEHLLLEDCPLCDGRGKVKSVVTEAHDLLREITRVHNQTGRTLLQVRVREDIRDWILEEERDWFQEIVDRWGLTVNFKHGEMTIAALQESSFDVSAE
ncbi:MAG: ribonuclease E/G, partial [Pseudomonadota bacterium]